MLPEIIFPIMQMLQKLLQVDGTYTLSDFDITDNIQGSGGAPYCNSTTDFAGWSIIIIYEDLTLALNQISLFDGLEIVYRSC